MNTLFRLCLSLSLLAPGCRSNQYRQGHQLYRFHCENCHMEDGSGLARLIPALTSSDLFDKSPEGLICLIRTGQPKNEATGQEMPANTSLNEVEMANLVNYLRKTYSTGASPVTTLDVKTCLAFCKGTDLGK